MLPLTFINSRGCNGGGNSMLPLFRKCTGKDEEEERREVKKIGRLLVAPAMAAVLALSTPYLISTPASQGQPIEVLKGGALFERSCIGCHDKGGNILQPGATLFTEDLERNGVATVEGLYKITYYGNGRMPGFGENCTPRGQCTFGPRLGDEEIELLAKFVKLQAERGWDGVESYGD